MGERFGVHAVAGGGELGDLVGPEHRPHDGVAESPVVRDVAAVHALVLTIP
jgi:hypothetical protein